MKAVITSPIGLSISKGNWEGSEWTLSGYPKADVIGHDYPNAYAFEEAVKKNFNCSGLDFDSESCQFYVYAKTKQRLVSLLSQIEKHYEKAKKMY